MAVPPYALVLSALAAAALAAAVALRRRAPAPAASVDPLPPAPAAEGRPPEDAGPRFAFLERQTPPDLARLLSSEDPADLAPLLAVLAAQEPALARRALGALGGPRQVETARALAAPPDEARAAAAERRLRAAAREAGAPR